MVVESAPHCTPPHFQPEGEVSILGSHMFSRVEPQGSLNFRSWASKCGSFNGNLQQTTKSSHPRTFGHFFDQFQTWFPGFGLFAKPKADCLLCSRHSDKDLGTQRGGF